MVSLHRNEALTKIDPKGPEGMKCSGFCLKNQHPDYDTELKKWDPESLHGFLNWM